jgi:hypothetical protein
MTIDVNGGRATLVNFKISMHPGIVKSRSDLGLDYDGLGFKKALLKLPAKEVEEMRMNHAGQSSRRRPSS